MILILHRYDFTPRLTRGVLFGPTGADLLAHTLEPPDAEWGAAEPCIPQPGRVGQTYPLRARRVGRWPRILRARFGGEFAAAIEVADVPGRSAILIHPGNRASDTRGCILPGLGAAGDAVTRSRAAWRRIAAIVLPAIAAGEDVRLLVTDFGRGRAAAVDRARSATRPGRRGGG